MLLTLLSLSLPPPYPPPELCVRRSSMFPLAVFRGGEGLLGVVPDIYIYINTYIHTYVYTYIHIYMYVYI
jgi:hypothetical protein